ncbi:uncharacterized protein [Ptychodera flava]|uniref:uncharacterized protein n=1 Tax=Ptychodera flava TaxID=63121 RepID=UPI00396A046E
MMGTFIGFVLLVLFISVSGQDTELVNIALGKPTEQSSTDWHADSFNAVDGDSDGEFCHGTCTLTKKEHHPWWRVNLMRPREVFKVVIKNRKDCCTTRLVGAEVTVGNHEELEGDANTVCGGPVTNAMVEASDTITLDCTENGVPLSGQFIAIQIKGKEEAMSLCEVEVLSDKIEVDVDIIEPGVIVRPPTLICTVPSGLVNIAPFKVTSQSSRSGKASASRAIDRNKNSDFAYGSCSMTSAEQEPWWKLDMLEPYDVYKVTITNRQDCCASDILNAEVRVGNSEDMFENAVCGGLVPEDVVEQETIDVICACGIPLAGRYVSIQLIANGVLTLCEVEVYVNPVPAVVVTAAPGVPGGVVGTGEPGTVIPGQPIPGPIPGVPGPGQVTLEPGQPLPGPGQVTLEPGQPGQPIPGPVVPGPVIPGQPIPVPGQPIPIPGQPVPVPGGLTPGEGVEGVCFMPGDVENTAYNMPAYQSSVDRGGVASRAVDGETNSDFASDSCMHTAREQDPWWKVDLQLPHYVYAVKITNRQDSHEFRLKGAEIRIGDRDDFTKNPICGVGPLDDATAILETIWVSCACGIPLRGRFVSIQLAGRVNVLHICEVEVWSRPAQDLVTIDWGTAATFTFGPFVTTSEPCPLPIGLINAAKNTNPTQSSVNKGGVAEKAVDGDRNSDFLDGRSCTFTKRERQPWWKVDLGKTYEVFKVTITNRMDCCPFRLKNAEIRVGDDKKMDNNQLCGSRITGRKALQETIHMICDCGNPMLGRYVSVRLVDRTQVLTLCEVEIWTNEVFHPTTLPPVPTTLDPCAVPETLVNVAIDRPAIQSSVKGGAGPERAVDGNLNSDFAGNSCTQTQKEEDPYWQVDLGKFRDIYHVTITNRADCCSYRLKEVEVHVSFTSDFSQFEMCGERISGQAANEETIDVNCKCGEPIIGRYVRVMLHGERKMLTLCEVQVFAYGPVEFTTEPTITDHPCPMPDDLLNVAEGRLTQQSSVKQGQVPENAVDGDLNSNLADGSCSMTDKQYSPWWQVDLGRHRDIYHVTITNRMDCCSFRLKEVQVRISDTPNFEESSVICGHKVSGQAANEETIDIICNCDGPITGRYVTVELHNKTNMLTLCEVQVWSYGPVEFTTVQPPTIPPCEIPDGVINIAKGKQVRQSSTQGKRDAELAVDGDKTGVYKVCASTGKEEAPWFQIDLGNTYDIFGVVITNRIDCCSYRLKNAVVKIGDTPNMLKTVKCGEYPLTKEEANQETVPIVCACGLPVRGRYVTIQIAELTQSLTLCEVEVLVPDTIQPSLPTNPPWGPTTINPFATTPAVCPTPKGLVNQARHNPVFQSSKKRSGVPARAIDGDKNSDYSGQSCTQTAKEKNPYWTVDLLRPRSVFEVIITNRMDCCSYRIRGAQIRVGNHQNIGLNPICGPEEGVSKLDAREETIRVSCACGQPVRGQYVSIQIIGEKEILSLCEVEILAYSDEMEIPTTILPTTLPGTTELVCYVPPEATNVARGKVTSASSRRNYGDSERIVDGIKDSDFYHDSCMLTKNEREPWALIDLGQSYDVYKVVITNRMDCCSFKLANAEIRIGNRANMDENHLCGQRLSRGDVAGTETIEVICHCNSFAQGRYVSIKLAEIKKPLSICEVEVYGVP